MASSDSCLAAVFHGPEQRFELLHVDVPRVEAGEAIVRLELSTICGSDLHTTSGARNEVVPCVLGHESIGTVIELSDPPATDVVGEPLEIGDRVTWSICLSCGDCDRCTRGIPQKCRSLVKYGHALAEGRYTLSGGLAECILLRRGTAIVRVGADLPGRVASPANCATATVIAALRKCGELRGRRVMILGAGMLGLTAAAIASARGASSTVIADPCAARIRWAAHFGAQAFEGALVEDEVSDRPDVILECSGSPDAVQFALRTGGIGAHVILVGSVMPSPDSRLDPEFVIRNLQTICGVHNYQPQDLVDAIDFLRRYHQNYPFSELVEMTFPLRSVTEAFQFASVNRPIRVAVRP